MHRPVFALVSLLALTAFAPVPAFADLATGIWPAVKAPPTVLVPAGYRYVWGDEFSGPDDSAPDPSKWVYERGFERNKEAQYYTKDRRENARVEKGRLILEARHEKFSEGKKTADYTSASVVTKGKFAFLYGRVEISAKCPAGVGTWPALWLMGHDPAQGGWPRCGELDIFEHLGYEPGRVYSTVHTGADQPDPKTGKSHHMSGGHINKVDTIGSFHLYAMDWSPEKIVFTCDGKVVHTYEKAGKSENTWRFDKPFYLLMNLAIGGGWGGAKGIDDKAFPCRFEIDYIRVFQRDGK